MLTSADDSKDRSLTDAPLPELVGSSAIPKLAGEALLEEEQIVRLDNTPCSTTTKKGLWCECFPYLNRFPQEVRASELQLTDCMHPSRPSQLPAYYLYYVGRTGIGPYSFASTQFQNLIYLAGWDPVILPATLGNCTNVCVIGWGGKLQPTTLVVLDVLGISFAAQLLVFLFLGSF